MLDGLASANETEQAAVTQCCEYCKTIKKETVENN